MTKRYKNTGDVDDRETEIQDKQGDEEINSVEVMNMYNEQIKGSKEKLDQGYQ